MDLLTNLYIVEKNITIFVFRLIHKYYTDIVNEQYNELYGPDPDKIAGCYRYDIGFQFNYRSLHNPGFFPRKIFNLYTGVDLSADIPLRYQFSNGTGFKYNNQLRTALRQK